MKIIKCDNCGQEMTYDSHKPNFFGGANDVLFPGGDIRATVKLDFTIVRKPGDAQHLDLCKVCRVKALHLLFDPKQTVSPAKSEDAQNAMTIVTFGAFGHIAHDALKKIYQNTKCSWSQSVAKEAIATCDKMLKNFPKGL